MKSVVLRCENELWLNGGIQGLIDCLGVRKCVKLHA